MKEPINNYQLPINNQITNDKMTKLLVIEACGLVIAAGGVRDG